MGSYRTITRGNRTYISLMAGLVLCSITACSSDQPKPLPQPTPDQVRGHADRTFDRLKQEERDHAGQAGSPH
jgi:hypothetical protein